MINLPSNISVAWSPLKGTYQNGKYVMSSQELALTCPCDTVFMSSSRASGKTEVSLIMFAMNVGKGYGKYYKGVYLDLHYPDLQDVIARANRLFPKIFGKRGRFYSSKGDQKWIWDTGEELLFRVGCCEADYNSFHGQEFAVLLFNELTKHPTPDFFDLMKTTNRTSFIPEENPYYIDGEYFQKTHLEKRVTEDSPNAVRCLLPPLRPRIIITTNPSGAGKNWVKERFVDSCLPAGSIHKITTEAYNPKTKQVETMTKTMCHIFSSYKENYHLSPEYVLELENIEDPERRRAWLYGDWEANDGMGMFNDIWSNKTHVVPSINPSEIPRGWYIDRAFDWGWSKPFSVGWYAESDGSDLKFADGTTMHTVRGDKFRFAEFYGCIKGKPNKGLTMLASDVAKVIIEREISMGIFARVHDGCADSAINRDDDGHSVAEEMRKPVHLNGEIYNGVSWLNSNKSAGTRSIGWELIRKRLRNSLAPKDNCGRILPRENAGFFVTTDCKEFLRTFPNLQRDTRLEFDIDTDSEDHIADELRYEILNSDYSRVGNKSKGMI